MRPSLILGLLFFKNELCVDTCRDILMQRLVLEFQRFRSKVVMQSNDVYFQELSTTDIDMQLHCQEVEARGWAQTDIDKFLSYQYKVNKPSDAPLWVFYVLNNLADGRSCLVANIDHCIGDGITMIQVTPTVFKRTTCIDVQRKKTDVRVIIALLIILVGCCVVLLCARC